MDLSSGLRRTCIRATPYVMATVLLMAFLTAPSSGASPRPASVSLTQQAELTATGGATGDALGYSVALSADGSTALVGAFNETTFDGHAYVFVRSGSTWSEQSQLLPSNPTTEMEFGLSVALSSNGSIALVGAAGAGGAYLYTRSGTTWTQRDELVSPGGDFAESVALSSDGSTAMIGGPVAHAHDGVAYVYTGSGSTWTLQQTLTPSDPAEDEFGFSVALSSDGSTGLIGADFTAFQPSSTHHETDAAYVFTRTGTTWSQQQKLTASNPSEHVGSGDGNGDRFGVSVALSSDGSTALIGAPDWNAERGADYVFTRAAGTWTQQVTDSCAIDISDFVGISVSLASDGSTALLGVPYFGADGGEACVYTRSGSAWTYQGTLTASDTAENDLFGYAVSLSGNASEALLGSIGNDSSTGAAYVFSNPTPAPTITKVAPASGIAGAKVTITGTNLAGALGVSFNGTAAVIATDTVTKITTTVPAGASTGNVAVTTAGGTAMSPKVFTVKAPTITKLAPVKGKVGTKVTITGTNLTGATSVTFNGTSATPITVVSATKITVKVPAGASTGHVMVTTPGGTATSPTVFTVT